MDPTPATATTAPAETSEFPKPLVRLRPVVGGYEADVRLVADAEAEGTATAEGWQAVAIPEGYAYQQYPRWLYHKDGRRQVVHTQEEADALEGYDEQPPPPEEPAPKGVPPPQGDVVATASPNRPPVPADRG
jgi:hypothetical protein